MCSIKYCLRYLILNIWLLFELYALVQSFRKQYFQNNYESNLSSLNICRILQTQNSNSSHFLRIYIIYDKMLNKIGQQIVCKFTDHSLFEFLTNFFLSIFDNSQKNQWNINLEQPCLRHWCLLKKLFLLMNKCWVCKETLKSITKNDTANQGPLTHIFMYVTYIIIFILCTQC